MEVRAKSLAAYWRFLEEIRMGKIKTSRRLNPSLQNTLIKHETGSKRLRNPKLIKEILIEALVNDDLETVKDVLIVHLVAQPKSKLARETGLGRQTLYDLIKPDGEFNPTLETLGALLKKVS